MHSKRRALVALAAAGTAFVLLAGPEARRGSAPLKPALAAEPGAAATPEERAGYWVDRIVLGPEPTPYLIPDFHQSLLLDAIRNLQATPAATLDRLADPALLARVTTQADGNPWHAILTALEPIGPVRPAVARAWAVPALSSDILTLRREAVPVLAALASTDDAPTLLSALERDADDRVVAPSCLKALLALGRPWDAVAVRLLLERGVADRPDGESASWVELPAALAEKRGGSDGSLLAWWALLAETSAPRAKDPRGPRRIRAEPVPAPAVPPGSALGSGRADAARARAALAKAGFAAYIASVRADAAGKDPALAAAAREARIGTGGQGSRGEARAAAAAWLDALAKGAAVARGPALEEAAAAEAFVAALGADEDPAAAALLERFLRELPAGPLWTPTIQMSYDALARRGSEPSRVVREWLASDDPGLADRALVVIRHTKDREYVPILEAWVDRPGGAARRPQGRRLVLLLITFMLAEDGLDTESLSGWARKATEWALDPSDPSAAGILGTLVDLGPPGEAQIVAGLKGPQRPAYVAILGKPVGRYLRPEVVEALLAPVGPDTPVSERRRLLDAAFAVAGGDSSGVLEALVRRLRAEAQPDAEMVARIVRHRAPASR